MAELTALAEPSLLVPAMRRDLSMRALETLSARMASINLANTVLYDFDNVDASALPHLAEQFNVLGIGWPLAATEQAQRAMLKEAINLHRHKGTPWAVKRVFLLLGLGDVDIDEGRSGYRRDGTMRRDGFAVRNTRDAHWTEYRVRCHRLLTTEQADMARAMLKNIAPARCHLVEINFSDASLIRNGFARRDGTYTRGIT